MNLHELWGSARDFLAGFFAHQMESGLLFLLVAGSSQAISFFIPRQNIGYKKRILSDLAAYAAVIVFTIPASIIGACYSWLVDRYEPESVRQAMTSFAHAPILLRAPIIFLLADFTNYWGHRVQHTKFFWRFHRWHHSVEELYPLSAVRRTPVQVVFFVFFFYSWARLIPLSTGELLFYSLVAELNCVALHSNWSDKFLRPLVKSGFLMTHSHHVIHHSKDHANSNYGFIFQFFDRLFGTYSSPLEHDLKTLPLGLRENVSEVRLALGLYDPSHKAKALETEGFETKELELGATPSLVRIPPGG